MNFIKRASAALLAVCLLQSAHAVDVYSNIAWGGALSGGWNSQNINVGAGSPFVTGNLPQGNIDWTGTGATGTVLTSPGAGQAPTWQASAAAPLRCTTGSIGGGLLIVGACTSGTATCTGATTAMQASASPVTYPGDGSDWKAYVSATNTVTVKVCAIVALTPTASNYNVAVIQ